MNHQSIPLVDVKHLSKSYGAVAALDDVSLQIHANEVVALLGENGAGKTTCIGSILGQLPNHQGDISVFGYLPGHIRAKQQIGVMLQAAALPDNLTVYEQLRLFANYYPNSRTLSEVLEIALLEGLETRSVQTLSGGQKQRLLFAMAIVGNPKLVILDEPTVGLDVSARREFWNCIRSLADSGVSVLLTTHYLEEADALSDRILVLSEGKLVAEGDTASIKSRLGGKSIRFKTEQSLAVIQNIITGTEVRMRGDYFEITSSAPEQHLRDLFTAGVEFNDLTVSNISLEDAFLNLTRSIHATTNRSPQTQQENAA